MLFWKEKETCHDLVILLLSLHDKNSRALPLLHSLQWSFSEQSSSHFIIVMELDASQR